MTETRVTDRHELYAVNRLVHDHWFNVEDVTHDPHRRIVSVRFLRPSHARAKTSHRILFLRRVRVPMTEWLLEIGNVESCTLEETEDIGRYDFNKLHYREDTQTLTVKTGVPLIFRMVVNALDVTVRDTETVVAERIRTSF